MIPIYNINIQYQAVKWFGVRSSSCLQNVSRFRMLLSHKSKNSGVFLPINLHFVFLLIPKLGYSFCYANQELLEVFISEQKADLCHIKWSFEIKQWRSKQIQNSEVKFTGFLIEHFFSRWNAKWWWLNSIHVLNKWFSPFKIVCRLCFNKFQKKITLYLLMSEYYKCRYVNWLKRVCEQQVEKTTYVSISNTLLV